MPLKYLPVWGLLLLPCLLFGQKNRTVSQQILGFDREVLRLSFTLPNDPEVDFYAVELEFKNTTINPKTVIGGGAFLAPGPHKLTWFYALDGYKPEQLAGLEIRIRALATDSKGTVLADSRPFPCIACGWIGVGIGLAGSLIGGLIEFNAKKDYNEYCARRDPIDTWFAENGFANRQAAFDDVDGRHVLAQKITYPALVFLGAGLTCFLIDRAKKKRKARAGFSGLPDFEGPPRWVWQPVFEPASGMAGLGLRVRF